MPPPPRQPGQPMTLDEKFHAAVGLGQFASRWADLFLHIRAGSHHHGFHTIVSVFIGFLWIACNEPVLAVYFFYACVAMLVVNRIWRAPKKENSNYSGTPWLTVLFGLDELACKNAYHVLLLALSGAVLWGAGWKGIGSWLVASAVGMSVAGAYIGLRDNAMDRARNDALALQQVTMRRWQEADKPVTTRRGKARYILLLALLAGAGWLLYSGTIQLPHFVRAAEAQPDDGLTRLEAEWRAREAREQAQRRAWRRWNQGYGF